MDGSYIYVGVQNNLVINVYCLNLEDRRYESSYTFFVPCNLRYRQIQESNPFKTWMEIVLLKIQYPLKFFLSFEFDFTHKIVIVWDVTPRYCFYLILSQVSELCIYRGSAANYGGITHGSAFSLSTSFFLFYLFPYPHHIHIHEWLLLSSEFLLFLRKGWAGSSWYWCLVHDWNNSREEQHWI